MGYSDAEFIQTGGYDLIHPDDLKYYANAHKECNTNNTTILFDFFLFSIFKQCINLLKN